MVILRNSYQNTDKSPNETRSVDGIKVSPPPPPTPKK